MFSYFKLAYPGGDPPRGKSFAHVKMVITGSLSKHDVAEITAKVEAKGGVVVSKVDETVNLLVTGKKPNAKLVKKAEGLGQVVILDEARFAGLLPAPRREPGDIFIFYLFSQRFTLGFQILAASGEGARATKIDGRPKMTKNK